MDLCEDESICGTPFYIMKYIHGRVFKTAHLPDVPKEQRKEIYFAVVEALAKVHECDPVKIGLEKYGKLDGYLSRQIRTWTKQYRMVLEYSQISFKQSEKQSKEQQSKMKNAKKWRH